jgi:hypothetical protein
MLQIFLLIPTCEERNRILSVTVERYHVPVLRNILDHRMQNIKLHHGYSAHSVEMRTHPYITADCVMPFIESKFMCCCPGQDVAEPCLWDIFGQEPGRSICGTALQTARAGFPSTVKLRELPHARPCRLFSTGCRWTARSFSATEF